MTTRQMELAPLMRTTVDIDEDVLDAARKLAAVRDQSLGKVVSDLMRRGLAGSAEYPKREPGYPSFEASDDGAPISLEDVKRDEDEAD